MKANDKLTKVATLALLLLLAGCAGGTMLFSESAADLEVGRGSYNLILYGGQNSRDWSSVAILDRGGDAYTILPFGAKSNYRLIENLTADEALARGAQFLGNIQSYRALEKRAIYAPDHSVIGYELRPLFMPLDTGLAGDIVDTSYVLQPEHRVQVYVGFKYGYHDSLEADDAQGRWRF